VLEGHTQNVNGVAFAPDRRTLVSVSYDQSVRIWPLADTTSPTVVALPTPLNAVAVAGDGEIAAGGADSEMVVSLSVAALGPPAQPVDATQALNLSGGVSNCKVSRGRSLSWRATLFK
jgi:WD40 repeat protein